MYKPSNFRYLMNSADSEVAMYPGGDVVRVTAAVALLYGDVVFLNHASRASKHVESSLYPHSFLGVVVGGKNTSYHAAADSTLIGDQMSAAGEDVIVLTRGVAYVSADATGILKGMPLTAGRSTAGRVRGDLWNSYARNVAGLTIKTAGSALVKAANVVQTTVAGIAGTSTAANLDMAALSGTVTNGKHNVFVFRVASNGSTVSSAMGTEAATRDAIVWPTGSSTLVTLGGVFINPTGTGDFVGGTTALDDATVVPNAVYFDLVGLRPHVGYALANGGAAGTAVLAAIGL